MVRGTLVIMHMRWRWMGFRNGKSGGVEGDFQTDDEVMIDVDEAPIPFGGQTPS